MTVMSDLEVGVSVAFAAAFLAGSATWVAWITRQIIEHARLMAATAESLSVIREDVRAHDLVLRPYPQRVPPDPSAGPQPYPA